MNPDTNVPAASIAASSSTTPVNVASTSAASTPAPVASNQPKAKGQKGFGKKAKFAGNAPKL